MLEFITVSFFSIVVLRFIKQKGSKIGGKKLFWHHNVLNAKDMQADH